MCSTLAPFDSTSCTPDAKRAHARRHALLYRQSNRLRCSIVTPIAPEVEPPNWSIRSSSIAIESCG
jgi:hypothetical protein